jgi:hypothetical protein
MAVNKPRNRILIFRLTQDEYQTLQQASSGARSLSEFARAKLMDSLGTNHTDHHLMELKSTVARLADLLERN